MNHPITKRRARYLCRKIADWLITGQEKYLCLALDQLLNRTSATLSEVRALSDLLVATFKPEDASIGYSWWRPDSFSIDATDRCREARIVAILLLPELL